MLHLSCLFFYNLFYCYFYYIIFISKGKSWSFPWMFCFVFAVFWCCDKKHQSTSLPSLLKPLRFDMYVYLFYHLLSLLVICRSVAGNVVSVSLSILLTVFLYFLLIFYLPLSLVAMSVSLLRFCQSFQIFFFTDVSPFHKIQSHMYPAINLFFRQFMTTNDMHKNRRFLLIICWNCKDLCKVFIGLICWSHTVHYRS